MAAFSRGLRSYTSHIDPICLRCHLFSTTSAVQSGHSRWSKIKHEKGVADHRRSKANGFLSQAITYASKMGGPDPKFNLALAQALASAKKGGFPKANMEAAINRGQGKSASGAALEYVMLEAIMPPQVAMIIEAESDNSKRTLGDLKLVIKKAGGISTPTSYLFEKRGRIFFEEDEKLGVDDVLDEAIEAGAEDVEADEDNRIVVWTEPSKTTSAAVALQERLGLKVATSDVVWDANEDTKVPLDAEEHRDALKALKECIDKLRDTDNIQGVYANVAQGNMGEEDWEEIQDRLDS